MSGILDRPKELEISSWHVRCWGDCNMNKMGTGSGIAVAIPVFLLAWSGFTAFCE
jgi:hypothetical protein